MQHFYRKEVMTLSFLHRWDYSWKGKFDTDVKIENYNHHDGEQLLFYEKVNIKTQSKKKDILVVFIFIALYYCKKQRTQIYLVKTALKRNHKRTLNAIIQHEENWLEWIVTEKVSYK